MCQAPEWDTKTPFGPSSEIPPCVASPLLPLEDDTLIRKSLCLSAFCAVHCHPKGGEMKAVIADGSKRRWTGGLLNLPWNVWSEGTGPLPVWNKKRLVEAERMLLLWSQQWRESAESATGFLPRRRRLADGMGAGPRWPVISVFGCGSLAFLYRAPLSALPHEKLFWCGCWWRPTY